MKYLIIAILVASFSVLSGCASMINTVSDESLKNMSVEDRSKYRFGLDEADMIVDIAKTAYDKKYNKDGTEKVVEPAPTPADTK